MDLSFKIDGIFEKYHNWSQRSRVLTEQWFMDNMYCPNCLSESILHHKNNAHVKDFACGGCGRDMELKSQAAKLGRKVADGAHETMISEICGNRSPDFFFMEYSRDALAVKNLVCVPRFFINESIIFERPITYPKGRKNGWVGCDILISKLPDYGRINIVKDEHEVDRERVKREYARLGFLDEKKASARGWFSDVLYCVQKLKKDQFTLSDIYGFEQELKGLHSGNNNVRPKIRQQLQVLNEKGVVRRDAPGKYTYLG